MSLSDYMKLTDVEHADLFKDIGITRGIVVLKAKPGYRGKPFMVRVRDAASQKYDNTACENKTEVQRVAKDRWCAFQQGTDTAGSISTESILKLLLGRMQRRERKKQTIGEIERYLRAGIAAGIKDLKDPNLIPKTNRFLDTYRPKNGFGFRKGPHSPRSRVKYIGFWRQLGAECLTTTPRPLLSVNPFMALERPKVKEAEMEVLTLEECKRLVTDQALSRREGLHWAFRLYTTTRRREATWQRWSQIDFDANRIRVRLPDEIDRQEALRLGLDPETEGKAVKRDKPRRVRLDPELADMLRRIKPADAGDSYVFPESMRSRASTNEIKAFHNHLKACGINRPEIHPHELRSTGACIWAALIEEDKLQRHLGHGRENMTRHYTARADDFEEAMKGWDGRWHLRSAPGSNPRCTVGATAPLPLGPDGADGEIAPEDDIPDEFFILLPDISGLTIIA